MHTEHKQTIGGTGFVYYTAYGDGIIVPMDRWMDQLYIITNCTDTHIHTHSSIILSCKKMKSCHLGQHGCT